MFRPRYQQVVLLVAALTAITPLALADEPTKSGCVVMFGSTATQAGDGRVTLDGESFPCSRPALRSKLLAMAEEDQAVRGRINAEGETPELLEEESRIDWRNMARMKRIVDEFGWPTLSMVGEDGARAAWLVAMHADHDTKFQRRCLDLIEAEHEHGEVSPLQVAYLTDRIRTREGKLQVYGTQYDFLDGVRRYFPIEDLKHVEKRRAEVGLPPLGEYRELSKSLAITLGRPRPAPAQQGGQSEREAMYYRYLEFASYVQGGSIEPHWMADGSSFWYADAAPADTAIYKVDPKASTRTLLFDTERLRRALTPLLGHQPPYRGLPFDTFTFMDGEKAVKFTVEDKVFVLRLDAHTVTSAPSVSEEEQRRLIPQITRKGVGYPDLDLMEIPSPDGRWFAFLEDHNVWLRSIADDTRVQLTSDGIAGYEWRAVPVRSYSTWASWSSDSTKLALMKGDYREVPKIPIVDYLSPREEVLWISYSRAGEAIARTELFIVDILSQTRTRVETGLGPDQNALIVGWRSNGSELLFYRVDRYWQRVDLLAADSVTGRARLILSEFHPEFSQGQGQKMFTLLKNGKQFIWISERDGWYHLYLYAMSGKLIRRLTKGTFPVMEVLAVDEDRGWVYFTARAEKRLYDTHLYRIDLEGNNFTRLTEGTGQHEIAFAPSTEFFLDTHSNVDRPPAVELRRVDGTLLQVLSKATTDALVDELKWQPPEEFVVKAADGTSDLYGVLFKPYDFDPAKKYPVIDQNYGALSVVPHNFTRGWWARAFAQLGFIVFIVDSRGTDGQGRDFFQKTGSVQPGRHEIPDHVVTLNQLAETRPYMDLGRVALFGGSYGGYMTIRGMLLAPDVYQVGVAIAPLTELAAHWASESGMGPIEKNKEAYTYASNLRLADQLKGKLLLIHGTSDVNVPFSNTVKMIAALIRARKSYDLLVMPGQGHDSSDESLAYELEVIRSYFQEHLQP